MAQSGVYAPTPIQEVELTVRVNGVIRPHRTASWGGDTTGGLPDQVASTGTGMLSRTGSIQWASKGVQGDPHHPVRRVDGWPPRQGDAVVIDATVAGVTFRRFTGRLGVTTGSLIDDTLTSEITDVLADRMSSEVTIDPRLTGALGHSYRIAWEAVEQAGLGLLPQPSGPGTTVLHSVPQGDTWSTIGLVEQTQNAGRRDDPYGLVVWDHLISPLAEDARLGNSILVIARGATDRDSDVNLRLLDGTTFQLRHEVATGALTLLVNGIVAREAAWEGEGVPVLAFAVTFGFVYVWTALDYRVTATTASFSSKGDETWGRQIAATHVRYGQSADFNAIVASTPVYPASMRRTLLTTERARATRGVENVTARSVVDSWGEATLASMWADELGRVQMVARDRLVAPSRSRVVNIDERVMSGSWSIGEDSVYSRVVAVGEQPAIQRSAAGQYRITAHEEQSARGFDQTTVDLERFIEAETEVDWGPIDLTFARAGSQWVGGELNGSWVGAVVTDGPDTERWAQLAGVTYTVRLERLGQRTLKTTENISNIPAGETVYTKVASEHTNAHRAMRGRPLPIIRAQWLTTWARFTRSAGTGPSYAPTYEHEVGWWLTPGDAQRIINALAAEITSPMATFSSVVTLWDPRRQIGDVEDWVAVDGEGREAWRASVLVVGYDESWDGNVPTQTVSSRVISMTDPRSGKTYQDLANAYNTYADIESTNATYAQLLNALPNTA